MVIRESLLVVGAKMEKYQQSILIGDKWRQVLGIKILIVHMGIGSSMRGTVIHHIGVDSSIVILHMAMGSHNKGFGYSCKCNNHQQFMGETSFTLALKKNYNQTQNDDEDDEESSIQLETHSLWY